MRKCDERPGVPLHREESSEFLLRISSMKTAPLLPSCGHNQSDYTRSTEVKQLDEGIGNTLDGLLCAIWVLPYSCAGVWAAFAARVQMLGISVVRYLKDK
jgi:hypothetical protein